MGKVLAAAIDTSCSEFLLRPAILPLPHDLSTFRRTVRYPFQLYRHPAVTKAIVAAGRRSGGRFSS